MRKVYSKILYIILYILGGWTQVVSAMISSWMGELPSKDTDVLIIWGEPSFKEILLNYIKTNILWLALIIIIPLSYGIILWFKKDENSKIRWKKIINNSLISLEILLILSGLFYLGLFFNIWI